MGLIESITGDDKVVGSLVLIGAVVFLNGSLKVRDMVKSIYSICNFNDNIW